MRRFITSLLVGLLLVCGWGYAQEAAPLLVPAPADQVRLGMMQTELEELMGRPADNSGRISATIDGERCDMYEWTWWIGQYASVEMTVHILGGVVVGVVVQPEAAQIARLNLESTTVGKAPDRSIGETMRGISQRYMPSQRLQYSQPIQQRIMDRAMQIHNRDQLRKWRWQHGLPTQAPTAWERFMGLVDGDPW